MIRRLHRSALALLLLALLASPAFARPSTKQEKLKNIILPQLSFEDAKLKDVFTFIRARAKELDVEDEGVNIMLMVKPETLEQTVSMEFENIPLGEAIRYICMGSGLKFRVDKHAVVVGDGSSDMGSGMELRAYYIDAGVLDTGHNKKAGKLGE